MLQDRGAYLPLIVQQVERGNMGHIQERLINGVDFHLWGKAGKCLHDPI